MVGCRGRAGYAFNRRAQEDAAFLEMTLLSRGTYELHGSTDLFARANDEPALLSNFTNHSLLGCLTGNDSTPRQEGATGSNCRRQLCSLIAEDGVDAGPHHVLSSTLPLPEH